MNTERTVFAQLVDFLPMHTFRRCVQKYRGNYKVRRLSCLDHLLCMAFEQLIYRQSLRDIEAFLHCQETASSGSQSLHNSTDFERHRFRKIAYLTGN